MNDITLLIIGGVLIALLIAAVVVLRNRATTKLKSRFGPEYARAVDASGNRGQAEAELREREKRVNGFELKPLTPTDRARFTDSWRVAQTDFVDDPGKAVTVADELLGEVMAARGYPMGDFDQRSADISVDHPVVVENYRKAHEIAERHAQGKAGTEELRQAMVSYRSLFDELVSDGEAVPDPARPAAPAVESGEPVTAKGG